MKPTHEIMENNFHRVASANSVVSVQSGNRKKVASFLRKKVEEPLLRSGNSTLENLSCTVGTVVASSLSMLPMQLYRVSHILTDPIYCTQAIIIHSHKQEYIEVSRVFIKLLVLKKEPGKKYKLRVILAQIRYLNM